MGRTSFAFKDCWVALTIVSSAGFYFFDIITTLMTARVYYYLDVNYRGQTVMGYKGHNGKYLSGWDSEFTGTFASIISIIVVSHTLNAVIFCLNAKIKREAMKAAYLLPLLHLRRLAILVWRTGTLQGVSVLKSAEFEAIYTILVATLEAAPQLMLQSHALVRLQHTTWSEPRLTTKLSFAASYISAACNCSQAIMYTTNQKSFIGRVGILATSAVYSTSAILIRASGFICMIELAVNFNRVYALVYVVAILAPQAITYWWDASHLENRATSILKRLFLCSAFIYMSIGLGPLYTLTSTANKYRNRKWVYWGRILGLSFAHMIPDMLLVVYIETIPYKQHVYLGDNQHCGMLARTYIPPSGDPAPNFLSCWTGLIAFFTGVGAFVASTLCFVLVDMNAEAAEVEEGENNRGENVIEFKEWRRLRSNSRQSSTFIYTKIHGCIL
eukprot:Gb_40004 [translate_table: standard]